MGEGTFSSSSFPKGAEFLEHLANGRCSTRAKMQKVRLKGQRRRREGNRSPNTTPLMKVGPPAMDAMMLMRLSLEGSPSLGWWFYHVPELRDGLGLGPVDIGKASGHGLPMPCRRFQATERVCPRIRLVREVSDRDLQVASASKHCQDLRWDSHLAFPSERHGFLESRRIVAQKWAWGTRVPPKIHS